MLTSLSRALGQEASLLGLVQDRRAELATKHHVSLSCLHLGADLQTGSASQPGAPAFTSQAVTEAADRSSVSWQAGIGFTCSWVRARSSSGRRQVWPMTTSDVSWVKASRGPISARLRVPKSRWQLHMGGM